MNVTVTILLMSLLSATLIGFITESNINESGLFSIDKIYKISVFGIAFTILLFKRKKFYMQKDVWIYILMGFFFLLFLFINYLFSGDSYDLDTLRAKKEIIRITVLLMTFLLCAGLLSKISNYNVFIYSFTLFGLLISIFSLCQTITGQSGRISGYVGGYLRAGIDITGLSLGGILNITFTACLIGYLTKNNPIYRLLFFSILICIQCARFATFSTGTLLSSIITALTSIFLLKAYHTKALNAFLKITLFMVFLFSIFIWRAGLFSTVFYRVLLSDEHVKESSYYSRINQYKGYLKLIQEKPESIIFGVGSARLPELLGTNVDLHNSYLRPLAVGGIGTCICYLLLNWFCLRDFLFSIKMQHGDEIHLIVSILFLAAFIGWSFQAATFPADTSCVQWFFFIFAYLLRHAVSKTNSCTIRLVRP